VHREGNGLKYPEQSVQLPPKSHVGYDLKHAECGAIHTKPVFSVSAIQLTKIHVIEPIRVFFEGLVQFAQRWLAAFQALQ
jgi:hypothetical protein